MNKMLSTPLAVAALFVASVTASLTVSSVAFAQAPAAPQGDVKAGQAKVAMCIGCHGIQNYQASFPEIYKVPKIAGQGAGYIAAALTAYKAGDRKHPTMRAIADSLTEQDILNIAAFYAQQGKDGAALAAKASREPDAKVAALLQKGACVSCHGANFATPIDPAYPNIAGQHADYLFVALKAYKTDNNAKIGRNNGVMAGVAKQFTNAELKAMAGYVGSLDSHLKTVAQPRFK